MMIDSIIERKFNALKSIIKDTGNIAIGFSGGVDSTFLLKVCHDIAQGTEQKVAAITVESPMFSDSEREEAERICKGIGAEQYGINATWDDIKSFAHNPEDRCYLCKRIVFDKIIRVANELELKVVFDGTNADDKLDYRPGQKALQEMGVKSPLAEVGLTKLDIRLLSKSLGLDTWQKPAFACLASRIPYGEEITEGKLNMIGQVEEKLRGFGFEQLRVRHHGYVARIEILPEDRIKFFSLDMMDKVDAAVKEAGFRFAALDLAGYKMGSLNPTRE